MFKSLANIVVLIPFMVACAPGGPDAEESLGTAQILAATQIAETQRAALTDKLQQLATLTPPIKETETPFPVFTALPTRTATPTSLPPPSSTPWVNPKHRATLRFDNKTKENIFAVLRGNWSGEYNFSGSWNLTTPWGDYDYLVWIGDDGPYAGSFKITNQDKHTLVIEPGKVHFEGP